MFKVPLFQPIVIVDDFNQLFAVSIVREPLLISKRHIRDSGFLGKSVQNGVAVFLIKAFDFWESEVIDILRLRNEFAESLNVLWFAQIILLIVQISWYFRILDDSIVQAFLNLGGSIRRQVLDLRKIDEFDVIVLLDDLTEKINIFI